MKAIKKPPEIKMLAPIITMNTLMAYYLVRQKYWQSILIEMMSIKGKNDFGHNIVILFGL